MKKKTDEALLRALEKRCANVGLTFVGTKGMQRDVAPTKAAAALLGVTYNGSYSSYKNGKVTLPRYIRASAEAHLLLTDSDFALTLRERAKPLTGAHK